MLNEMPLIILQFGPVLWILAEINFIDSPEASHLVLVHFPHIWILDGQNDEPVGVIFEQGFAESDLRTANLTEL